MLPVRWGSVFIPFALLIPAWAQSAHTVAPGETLFSIARRYGATVEEIMRLNGLTSTLIRPGQVLRLPGGGGETPQGGGVALREGEPLPSPLEGEVHVVLPGETLFSIARRYGATVEEIARLNGLASPDDLQVGQVLKLPKPSPKPEEPSPAPKEDYDPESPLLKAVLRYLGVPYKYGANSPTSLDCSAFVAQVYAELGVALPRTTREQFRTLPPAGTLRPGDLVFFSFGGKEVDHVGIYLGRGLFAHASSYGSRVVIESLEAPHNRKAYRGARRPVLQEASGEGRPRQP